MRSSLLLLAVLATAIAVTSTSATTCGFGGYDFSSLTGADLTTSDATYTYYLRPCGVVSPASCTQVSASASACQVQVNPAGGSWVIGLNNPSWGLLPYGNGAYYNETGTQECWATGAPTNYYTNVEFMCSSNYSLSVYVNGCTQTYTVQTPLACSTPSTACGFNGFDFSSYTGVDIQGSDGSTTYNYWLRVCGSVSSVPSCSQIAPNAAACQVQVNPAGATFDNGNWAGYQSTSWQYLDPNNPSYGVGYSMIGAQSCWASGNPANYYTNVNFVCSQTEQPLTVSFYANSCTMNYTIATPKACSSPPPPASKCSYNGIDLSSLMGTDIQGSDGGSVYQYYLSVCGSVTSQPGCIQDSAQTSVCQVQVNPKGESFDIGNWSPYAQWYTIGENGIGYALTGSQSCWATGSPTDYYANVNFICSETQGPLTVTVPSLSCVQNYTYPTPLACKSQPTTPCQGTIDGVTYDLTSLTQSDLIWQYSQNEMFALHICGSVSTQPCAGSGLPASTSACLSSSQGIWDMGNNPPVQGLPPLQYMDPNVPSVGVTYQMTGDNTCAAEPGQDSPWIANVNVVCAQKQGSLTVSSISNCVYNWTIQSPLGCPPSHSFETKLPGFSDNDKVVPKPPKMPQPAIATE